jgi:hypothetical protein
MRDRKSRRQLCRRKILAIEISNRAKPVSMTQRLQDGAVSFRWTRELFLRALGFIYAVAFGSLAWQLIPLLGRAGVLPAAAYLARVRAAGGTFFDTPTLFWWSACDGLMRVACALGLLLSLALLAGLHHAAVLLILWAIYLSFVHVGQIFYGYGWEILLLEAGFLAIFLGSIATLRPKRTPSPIPIFLLRWLQPVVAQLAHAGAVHPPASTTNGSSTWFPVAGVIRFRPAPKARRAPESCSRWWPVACRSRRSPTCSPPSR